MKLVVVTGCYGFIGSYVTAACLKKGWKVYGIDKETYAANCNSEILKNVEPSLLSNMRYIKEDICNLRDLPDCDYVVNVAAETHVGNSIIDSTDFIHSNVMGVKNLLDIIRRKPNNVARKPIFFHFSTDEVYGDIAVGVHTEESPLMPSNPYSASKAAADMLIKAWARTYGIDYLILRPTNNYGIDQYPEKLIPLVIKLLQRARKIRLHNEGEPFRNWLHAEDTAQAVIRIIESDTINETFNVAGGFEQKNKDAVIKIINSYFNGSYDKKYFEYEDWLDLSYVREGQDVRYSIDDTKLRNLGWEPRRIFDQEIDQIVKHYKTNFRW
mgnify:CR=1 FL=1|tara:strand:- start:272 stop:1249 length:978 start_codon:yes stop_codon:yes gene_type:complete